MKQAQPEQRENGRNTPYRGTPSKYTYLPKAEYERRTAEHQKAVAAIIARNGATAGRQDRCITTPGQQACGRFSYTALPAALNIRAAGNPAVPVAAPPPIDPQEVAYVATARLQLTAPKPMIGPPPEINRWKMAAVGYPLWLWADGNLDPAPVADSVYDVAVSLDARLVKIVYDMGDGHKVSCTDVAHAWTRGVAANAKSPACGHVYQQPSLPRGEYTVTANAVWAVDWTVNGTTGTIPFYQSATTEVPVGELQVLVR